MRIFNATVITILTVFGIVLPTYLVQSLPDLPESPLIPIRMTKAVEPEAYSQQFVPLSAEQQQRNLSHYVSAAYRVPLDRANTIVGQVYKTAAYEGVEPSLVLGVIAQESRFVPNSTSSVGAQGLMQVMPDVHAALAATMIRGDQTLYDITPNVRTGTRILAEYVKGASGNVHAALVRYSGNATDYARKVFRYKENFDRVLNTNQS